MKKINCLVTAVLYFGLLVSTVCAADFSANVKIETRVGGYIIGEGTAFGQGSITTVSDDQGRQIFTNVNDPGKVIGTAADELEDTVFSFSGSVDNVTSTVVFDRTSVSDSVIRFDSFNVTVSDLFGRLSLSFYDWTYAAGTSANEGDYILSDIGFQGFYGKVKVNDLFSLGAGVGLNANSIRAIRLDANFAGINGYFETDFYLGVITHSVDNESSDRNNTNAITNSYTYTNEVGQNVNIGIIREFTIERLQLGFETKIYGDLLKVGLGITPAGTALHYYQTQLPTTTYYDDRGSEVATNADGTLPTNAVITNYGGLYVRDANSTFSGAVFTLDLSGTIPILGEFLSLDYGFQYSPDNIARYFAAEEANPAGAFLGTGNALSGQANIIKDFGTNNTNTLNDSRTLEQISIYPNTHSFQALQNSGNDFIEVFAINIKPIINLGQLSFSFPLLFQYYGAVISGYQVRDRALIIVSTDFVINWKPANGFFVMLRGELDFHNHTEIPGIENIGIAPGSGNPIPVATSILDAEGMPVILPNGSPDVIPFTQAEITELNARAKVVNEIGGYAPRVTETSGSTKYSGLAFSDFFIELRVGATFGVSSTK